MTNVKAFIPKQNQKLPDHYGMVLTFLNGDKKELELASHKIVDFVRIPSEDGKFKLEASHVPFIEFVTSEDKWGIVPIANVFVEFDERFSKIIALKQKENKNG